MIDRKFKFVAVNPCNQKVYTEENAVVFCAKDTCLPGALEDYKVRCIFEKCNDAHIESIGLLIERVKEFQKNIEVKVPDTDLPCEIDRCIGGKV